MAEFCTSSFSASAYLLLLLTSLGHLFSARCCVVEFVIDEQESAISLTSNVERPFPVTFATVNDEYVAEGLRGSLYADLGEGPCAQIAPNGDDVLEALARGATLSSSLSSLSSSSRLEFYPYNITLAAETVGTLVNIWDLGFETLLTFPAGTSFSAADAAGSAATGSAATLESTSSSGEVFTTSILAPQGESFPFGTYSSIADTSVVAGVNGSSIELNVTDFNITLSVPYVSEANPGIDGLTIYRLLGNLVLRGVAGCDAPSCGDNGRCGVSAGGEAGCQCSCGWSGPACDVSSGYCSEYGPAGGSTALQSCPTPVDPPAIVEPPVQAGTGAALQPCVGGPAGQTCDPRFETSNEVGQCACKDGFGGPRCQACETDVACASLFDGTDSTAVCGTAVEYSSNTTFKSYTCDLEGTGLETTIVPGTFYVTCNTTSPGAEVTVADGAYCLVNFVMQQYPDNPIICKASICSFVAGSPQVDCRTTSCACARDCPDLDGVFAKIENRPAIVSCDESNQCTFDIENFFVKLVAPCRTTECQVQGYNFEDGTYRVDQNTWLDPLLAAIPLVVLVAINAALLVFLIRHRDLYFAPEVSKLSVVGIGAATPAPPARAVAMHVTTPVAVTGTPSIQRLSFRNLTVALSGGNRRVLLDGVSGEALVGRVTGIMGPSGSGKTTLISFLSQRSNASNTVSSGDVSLDDRRLGASQAKVIGYCPQDSFLLPTLTVYESILYSAILRLPRNTAVADVHRVTQESISKVRLDAVASSYVGGSGRIRGISGGERRRVSVAMEIVTNPKIVLLDEPTSGLDSSSAKQVVSTLKSLASSGCIVMLSLHQPSPAIFNMLDSIFLLAAGCCLYNGPPSSAASYLKAVGLPAPPGEGVAEFMLECASDPATVDKLTHMVDRGSKEGSRRDSESSDAAPDDKLAKDVESSIGDNREATETTDNGSRQLQSTSLSSASIVTELATLTWRNGLDMIRNPSLLVLHWLLALGMGIFAGCVFFQVNLDTSGAQNRAGGLIFALAFFAFTSLTTVDLVFHEKTIVEREVNSGYYRRWTYVISKLVIDGLLLRFLPILLFSAPFYPMMGLDSDPSSVALFLMTLGTFAVTVGALSLAVTFSSSTAGQASFIMNILLLVCLLNSGFFVNADNMPDWISWLRYLSVFYYGYSVLITNEVSSLLFNFVVEGYTAVENVRGVTFLNILGVDPSGSTNYIIILDCLYAAFCLLALLFSYGGSLMAWTRRTGTR